MEAAAEWVRAMMADGHQVRSVRVGEPWAGAIREALPEVLLIAPLPGEGALIALVADRVYFANLATS